MSESSDEELLAELGVDFAARSTGGLTAQQERVVAGFEDILNFVKEHGRAPQHGEERDIFERLYAVRLDRLRAAPEFAALLAPVDEAGLLSGEFAARAAIPEPETDDELLAELGIEFGTAEGVAELTHVKPRAEARAVAEEIATRIVCKDFDRFKPLFAQVQKDLDKGLRKTRRFQVDAEIKDGEFFILGGQKAYIAEVGEEFRTEQDRRNSRLRVIFDNGTESHGLLRSLQRALYKDDAGRRITEPDAGPLFAVSPETEGVESGTIYVLRSRSNHPRIAAHRDVIHKIGVTGGEVEPRVANAKLDPTFLLADVEIVATYRLADINRSRLENLLHRFLASARLELEILDRFGNPVRPQEWFLVPLPVIDEIVKRIQDHSIVEFEYNPESATLKKVVGS